MVHLRYANAILQFFLPLITLTVLLHHITEFPLIAYLKQQVLANKLQYNIGLGLPGLT